MSGAQESAARERALLACAEAVERLRAADVAPEALAEYVPPRRGLLRTRPATMRPLGEAWRIGALLLGTDGRLFALGRATRAAERGRPGYQDLSREERREIAAAALRGGYAAGTPVNYDAVALPLDDPAGLAALADPGSPLGFAEGEIRVRWRAGAPLAGAPALSAFLAERVALLIDPPVGS
ncbi:hypothetical protein MUN78_12040 [Leucobacter allii]|uniref:Glutaminase n=1 Tax=Leucobacter allii TaxID=2932247 RepID=A0ABY4FJU3_9MICO|nr:hypothetical protein [Leucobacter allii]UOQ56403.1 hypothetical protein MUN78_12040 [Leucobacter allii]